MRKDYLGRDIVEMSIPDKDVLCYRCLRVYNLSKAPTTIPEKLDIRVPRCPNCKSQVYIS